MASNEATAFLTDDHDLIDLLPGRSFEVSFSGFRFFLIAASEVNLLNPLNRSKLASTLLAQADVGTCEQYFLHALPFRLHFYEAI
jgi:hypothetical protein